ncbi:hypothetical protein PV768_17565, partial [Pseudarthrobacter sp. CC4]|uniref:hypothetical protein n=1 Tax=Pseudarthrobacter sp. CC4 TaxID=3029190 RepID=UPI003B8BF51B
PPTPTSRPTCPTTASSTERSTTGDHALLTAGYYRARSRGGVPGRGIAGMIGGAAALATTPFSPWRPCRECFTGQRIGGRHPTTWDSNG